MPRLRVSAATAPATSPMSPASHVAASPIAWGNAVAPGPTRPWRASSKGTIGIPSLVSPTKYFWMALSFSAVPRASATLRTWSPKMPSFQASWPASRSPATMNS